MNEGFGDLSKRVEAGFDNVGDRIDELDQTVTRGMITIHVDLMSIEGTLDDFSARVDLGFGQLEARLGGLSDLLTDLVQAAKTPEQTWALEQFDIGRDALRKHLYHEAIEHFDRAINGYKDRTGYKLDHRPHHMLGILYRGPFDDFPADLVNLAKAEQAYISAVRYAGADYKEDAARAAPVRVRFSTLAPMV